MKTAIEIFREVWIDEFGHDIENDKQLEIICNGHDYMFTAMQKYAIEITKDLFTKEQVEELLKKQREICARELIYFFKDNGENWNNETNIIRNAPSPSLEQLKEQHNGLL